MTKMFGFHHKDVPKDQMRIRTRSVLTAVAVSFGLYALLLLVMHGALPKEGRAVLPLVPADTVYSIGGVLPPLTSCPLGVSRDACEGAAYVVYGDPVVTAALVRHLSTMPASVSVVGGCAFLAHPSALGGVAVTPSCGEPSPYDRPGPPAAIRATTWYGHVENDTHHTPPPEMYWRLAVLLPTSAFRIMNTSAVCPRVDLPVRAALPPPPASVLWLFVCCRCCGFSVEVQGLLVPLLQLRPNNIYTGQNASCHCPMSCSESAAIDAAVVNTSRESTEVSFTGRTWYVVMHAQPGFYDGFLQLPFVKSLNHPRLIARTMSEFLPIAPAEVAVLNNDTACHSVWVPAEFWRDVYVKSGVRESKIMVVPEPVDTVRFDPATTPRVPMLSLVSAWRHAVAFPQFMTSLRDPFVYLSVFKWELRKGWRYLLDAFFTLPPDLSRLLVIHTFLPADAYTDGSGVDRRDPTAITELIHSMFSDRAAMPVVVVTHVLTDAEMASMFRAADSFVLPSCGEGWGLPVAQAMAMGLPSITTAWSGMTEFTTNRTAFLVGIESSMEEVFSGDGKMMAVPSVAELRAHMETVARSPATAAAFGARARVDMVARFSREVIAARVNALLK